MTDKKGSNVDAEIRLELAEFKVNINDTITTLIKAGFREIQDHLTELFNKDIDYIKETQDRHSGHHTQHFTNNQDRIQDISEIKSLIIKQGVVKETEDNIEEKTNRKKEISMGRVVLICGVASVITAIIAVVVTLLLS